jgi:acetyl-CoA synthetase
VEVLTGRCAEKPSERKTSPVASDVGQSAIETILLEKRRYPPPEEFAKQATAKPAIYEDGFEAFWEPAGRERITWFEPFTELHEWEPPYAKFSLGGELNICFNCVDRHVEAGSCGAVGVRSRGSPVVFQREVPRWQ